MDLLCINFSWEFGLQTYNVETLMLHPSTNPINLYPNICIVVDFIITIKRGHGIRETYFMELIMSARTNYLKLKGNKFAILKFWSGYNLIHN